MVFETRKDPKLHVGERTDRQRNLFLDQTADKPLVLHRPHAVVDPSRLQDIQRFPDVRRRSFLAGVRDCQEAGLTRTVVDVLELRGRMANL